MHYTVLHHLDKDKTVVSARVKMLEHNLKGFYYWWAKRGLALPMPRERLLAILTNDDYEFKKSCKGLSSASAVYDGFHSPRENVLGLALTPLDDSFVQLKLFSDPMYTEPVTFEVVLRGLPHTQITKPEQLQASILAMCRKSLEDSLEKASIGHNASRQLLYATGLLPPHVLVPSWVDQGMSSIFETPPGHPWETLGAPSRLSAPGPQAKKRKQARGSGRRHLTPDRHRRLFPPGQRQPEGQGRSPEGEGHRLAAVLLSSPQRARQTPGLLQGAGKTAP